LINILNDRSYVLVAMALGFVGGLLAAFLIITMLAPSPSLVMRMGDSQVTCYKEKATE